MTELEFLLYLCWASIAISAVAMVFTIIPTMRANGTRPILFTLSLVSTASFIGAFFSLFITYAIDQVNSTGLAEVGVFYLQILPGGIALALIWLGWRMRKGGKH